MQTDSLKDVLRLAQLSNDHDLWLATATKLILYTSPLDRQARVENDELLARSMTAFHYDASLTLERRAAICAIAGYLPSWQIVNGLNAAKRVNQDFLSILATVPAAHQLLKALLESVGQQHDQGSHAKLISTADGAPDHASTYLLSIKLFESDGAKGGATLTDSKIAKAARDLRAGILGADNLPLLFDLLVEAEALSGQSQKSVRATLAKAFCECTMPGPGETGRQGLALAIAQQIRTGPLLKVLGTAKDHEKTACLVQWLIGNPLAHGFLRALQRRDTTLATTIDGHLSDTGPVSPPTLAEVHFAHEVGTAATNHSERWQSAQSSDIETRDAQSGFELRTIRRWLHRYQLTETVAKTVSGYDRDESGHAARWRNIVHLSVNHGQAENGDLITLPSEAAALSENGALRIALNHLSTLENAPESTRLSFGVVLQAHGFDTLAAALIRDCSTSSQKAALLYGRALDKIENPERRIAVWQKLVETHQAPAFLVSYAAALIDGLRYSEADAVIAKLVSRSKDQSTLHRNEILMLSRQGKLIAAHQRARELATRFPDCKVVEGDHVRTGFEVGEPAPGIQTDAKIEHDNTNLLRALSDHDLAIGEIASAHALRSRVAEHTQNPNDYHRQLNAIFAQGKFREASEFCNELKQRFPGTPAFWKKAGQVCERQRNYDGMLYNFTEMLALNPLEEGARSAIARALIYLDRIDEALEWLGDCATGKDGNVWTFILRGFAYARKDDRNEARRALDRAYDQCATVMVKHREGLSKDPTNVYLLDDQHVSHPSENAPHVLRNFDAWLAALEQGSNALIGNSPSLLDQGLGSNIDDHDTVIRLNDFVIEGYEKDLGTKTDYWYSSANRQAAPHRPSVLQAKTLMMQPHARHFPDIAAFSRGRLGFELDPKETGYLAPCVKMMSECLSYPFPSTGFRMIQILEFLVQRPFSAFGFDFFSSGEMHYFDVGETHLQVGEVHAIDFERDLVNELIIPYGRHANFA